MNKKVIFLVFHCMVTSVFAMKKSSKEQPWIKPHGYVFVEYSGKSIRVGITHYTDISDIKDYFFHKDGISVEQQQLYPLFHC